MAKLDLTDATVRKLTTTKAQEVVWDKACQGLGLVYSRTGKKSWVVQRRNKRRAFGIYDPASPRHLPLAAARKRASEQIRAIDNGLDHPTPPPLFTLQTALSNHLQGMANKGRSELSIIHLRETARRYLSDDGGKRRKLWDNWMGLELQDITRPMCRERHALVAKHCGKYAANAAMRALRTVWNTARVEDERLTESPTIVLRPHWFEEERVQSPVEDLPSWAARVAKLDNPTRRHLYWTILLTGMRSTDARTVRWEDLNFKAGTLFRPRPKGGKKKAFTISLSRATLALLRLQRRYVYRTHPRSPWVFPAIGRDCKITHVKDALIRDKWMMVDGKKVLRKGLPSVHRLRDTFASLATEAGIGYFDLQVLLNHSLPKGVTGGYVKQSNPHIRACQEKVTALILERIGVRRR